MRFARLSGREPHPTANFSGPISMAQTPLIDRSLHRTWLSDQMISLVTFHLRGAEAGSRTGFRALDRSGKPLNSGHEIFQLHDVTRMVHCCCLLRQLGLPGLDAAIDQGMDFIWNAHRDVVHGGYFWSVTDDGPADDRKLAYGQAFVLLAASSALRVEHSRATTLLSDVAQIIDARFWEAEFGAVRDEYSSDWSQLADYRGQNANMHMCEALMAAHHATGDRLFLERAVAIAERIINRTARECGWRVAEHFDSDWQLDRDYEGDPIFQPAGTTPGHALEWSRLLLQLWDLDGSRAGWMPHAASALFHNAMRTGWDNEFGGIRYTLDWDDKPLRPIRLWWPNAEAIGAAAQLHRVLADREALAWYEKIWNFVAWRFVDREHGGWFAEIDAKGTPREDIFRGKPDLYHAFQACLISLLPAGIHLTSDLTGALQRQDGFRSKIR
jgi:mannose/cellobiose epimerase-like protein (N-acyl-D-glucosamine 2-epimerase family)